MNHSKLFDSKTDPIPGIRRDIEIIPIQDNGKSYLYFHDMLGYTTPNFALNDQARGLLSLLDGRKSIKDLSPFLGNGANEDQLLDYIRFLDENRLLRSPHFREHANHIEHEYEKSDTHHSVTAGSSYPADPEELIEYLDEAFAQAPDQKLKGAPEHIKALYAPHIDPRVGLDNYVKAFAPLKNLRPKRVVILATSHYSGLYPKIYQNKPFILIDKDFELPLKTIYHDRESIDHILESSKGKGVTPKDRAHRIEHSIELHLLFLSYLWNHEFSIVPILVGGFDELYYMEDGELGRQTQALGSLLDESYGSDPDTLFLVSGDLAHIGKKFGDDVAARSLFGEVEKFDQRFLGYAEEGAKDQIVQLMSERHDPYRICGFPPLYTLLQTMPDLKGQRLSYDLWDETVRESAVTFGSIAFWSNDKTS